MSLKSNNSQKLRFIAVGGINTAIDFGLLFGLKALGLPTIPANIISTTTAFCFSFFANKKYTFKTTDTNVKRELVLFILITLFGLWVLQTIIIYGITELLAPTKIANVIILLVAKLCATIITLIWNYILYSRVVFRKDNQLQK